MSFSKVDFSGFPKAISMRDRPDVFYSLLKPVAIQNRLATGRSVVTLRMRNGTSQSPFRPRLSRQIIVPRPPCVRAASPHPRKLGAGYAALPQMALRRVGCACIWSPPATGPAAPSPLRPHARAYAYRGRATRGRTRIYHGDQRSGVLPPVPYRAVRWG